MLYTDIRYEDQFCIDLRTYLTRTGTFKCLVLLLVLIAQVENQNQQFIHLFAFKISNHIWCGVFIENF